MGEKRLINKLFGADGRRSWGKGRRKKQLRVRRPKSQRRKRQCKVLRGSASVSGEGVGEGGGGGGGVGGRRDSCRAQAKGRTRGVSVDSQKYERVENNGEVKAAQGMKSKNHHSGYHSAGMKKTEKLIFDGGAKAGEQEASLKESCSDDQLHFFTKVD